MDEKKKVKISMVVSVLASVSVKPVIETGGIDFCPHCKKRLKKLESGVSSFYCPECGGWSITKR